MTASATPPNFVAYEQEFTLLHQDGTEFVADMRTIDYYRQYGIKLALNYGTQIGSSVILILVLLLLTRQEKRKSWVFIMNTICLLLNTIRTTLQCLHLTGEFWRPYTLVSGDFSRVTSADYANTVSANTLTLLLVISIMISLGLQVWAVCVTAPRVQRLVTMGITTTVALVAVGCRFAVVVISNKQTMRDESMEPYWSLLTAMYVLQALAIWVYCCVFISKLGYAIVQRRRLRMTQFGPMQVIFIMGCQTMIIPAIFTTLQFYEQAPELGTQALTMTCIFLPLSAIWAGIVSNDSGIGSRGPDAHQKLLCNEFYQSQASYVTDSEMSEKKSRVDISIHGNSGKDLESPTSLCRTKSQVEDDVIHVDQDWSVVHDDASS